MIEIHYNNTLEEIKKGYNKFRQKYSMRRAIAMSIIYGVFFVLALDIFIKSPQGERGSYVGLIAMALSLAFIVWQWFKPYLARQKILSALGDLPEERYTAKFYDEKIVIETIVRDEPVSDDISEPLENEDSSQSEEKIYPSEYNIANERLESYEDQELFLLFVNRSLIYIFPKRCLSAEQTEELSGYFSDKAI